MCTNYDRSALRVFEQFRPEEPVSLDQVAEALGEEVPYLMLGDESLYGFLRSMKSAGCFSVDVSGYTLTDEGVRVKQYFEHVVADVS